MINFKKFSQLTEFFSRLWLVNVPTYVVTQIPEVNVCVTYMFSYVLVQNVGFLWAFLVNASFAVACQVAAFLPFQAGMDTYTLVGSFYLVYSSVRVITHFAAATGRCAIFCLQNFAGIEKILLIERVHAVKFYHVVFSSIFLMELTLLSSEFFCAKWFPISAYTCHDRGMLRLLTQRFPHNRRLLYCLLSAVVMSLWQCVMHQFPRWNKSITHTSRRVRIFFRVFIAVLSLSTLVSLTLLVVTRVHPSVVVVLDHVMCMLLFGWTLMLYLLVPLLVAASGEEWINNTSPKSLKRLCLILCMSQGFFIIAYTLYRSFDIGLIKGQLEFVVACFCLPSFWIILFMVGRGVTQVSHYLYTYLYRYLCLYPYPYSVFLLNNNASTNNNTPCRRPGTWLWRECPRPPLPPSPCPGWLRWGGTGRQCSCSCTHTVGAGGSSVLVVVVCWY
jgi:hypothetical protein